MGDSITAENISLQWVIKGYKTLDNHSGVRFFNCGVAGGTAEFAIESYTSDVKRYKPTHAVVSFGINDSGRELLREKRTSERLAALTEAYEKYKINMTKLVDMLLTDGVDVTLCTPFPYDEYSDGGEEPLRGGYALMLGYSEFVRSFAREKGVKLYDANEIISRTMASESVYSPDRIHPHPYGYYILAREFLKEQGILISADDSIDERYARWHSYVARLRKVQAAECMLVRGLGIPFSAPTEEKMAAMTERVRTENFGRPVFESFYRAYVADKPHEAELYRLIDEAYENEIM
jgi:lysophospholipase L1-like esterase